MKKLLIASAIAMAVSAAHAQNAQVYGVVDSGVQSHDNGTTRYTRAANNLFATSRFGIRASEDLGKGLRADIWLESQLNPSEGSVGSTTVAANEIFNREANLGLTGGFGSIRVGRQDVSFAQDIDIGVSQFGIFGLRPVNGTAVELGVDQKNVVKYTTPQIAGFTVQAGRSTNANGATTDAGTDQTSAHVRFDAGKLAVHAGWQKNKAATTAAERDFTAYGAAYDLGVASVGYSYAEGDVSTTGTVKSTTHIASVRVPLGAGLAAHGVYAQAKDGAQASAGEGKGYTVGVSKAMSKRTTLYAAYTAVDNQANSSMVMQGQVAAPATAGLDPKTMAVGISHTF